MRNRNGDHESKHLETSELPCIPADRLRIPYQTLDTGGVIRSVNAAWLESFRHDPDEVIGRAFGEFLAPESKATFESGLKQLRTINEEPDDVQLDVLCADGSCTTIRFQQIGEYTAGGDLLRVHCLLRCDASKRSDVTQADRAHDLLLRAMFKYSPDALCVVNLQSGEMAFCNRDSFFGHPVHELCQPERLLSVIHPEDAQRVSAHCHVWTCHPKIAQADLEYRLKTTAGAWEWIRSREAVISWDAQGVPLQLMVALSVITREKEVEIALEMERDRVQKYLDVAGVMFVVIGADQRIQLINAKGCEILGATESQVVGENWFDTFIPLADRTPIREIFSQLIAGSIEPVEYYENTVITRTGEERLIAWHNTILNGEDGKIIGTLSSGVDITESRSSQLALHQRADQLTALLLAARALSWLRGPEELSTEIIKVLEATLGYEYASVLVIDEDTGRLVPFAVTDQGQGDAFAKKDKQLVASHRLSVGHGIVGWVAAHGETVRTGDVRTDPRYYPMRDDLRSEMCVPIRIGGRIHGVVNVESPLPDAYTKTDEYVLETVATQIGVALENARLYGERLASEEALRASTTQLRDLRTQLEATAEEERRRIARELHDQVSQNLTALAINVRAAHAQLSESIERPRQRLDEASALIEETTDHIRALTFELRPPVLDDFGLVAALEWHAARVTAQTGLVVSVDGDEAEPRLPRLTEIALFRIAQEALTNIIKHAHTTTAHVHVTADERSIRLDIDDPGIGFDPSQATHRDAKIGWGLLNMRERAEALGGSFSIASSQERGTQITVEVPR